MSNESSGVPTQSSTATGFLLGEGLLTVLASPEDAGRSVEVGPRGSVIGRDAACDLTLASEHVSRRHAVVRVRDGTYEVEDLGSKNGTLLNGGHVRGTRPLRDGDRIGVADVEIEFRRAGTGAVADAAPRRSRPRPAAHWQPDHLTAAMGRVPPDPGQPPPQSLRQVLHEAPGFSTRALLLAVSGSVVGTVLTGAAGAGAWGTLVGAAVVPVVSTTFSTKQTGEKGRMRAAAIALLSLSALAITWASVSIADRAAGTSVLAGNDERPSTFPGPAAEHSDPPADPSTSAVSASATSGGSTSAPAATGTADPTVVASPVDCGAVAVGVTASCAPVVLTYNGDAQLHITGVEMTGEHAGDFTAGDECVDRRLDPGQTCGTSITFRPSATDQRSATLVIHQNLPAPDTGTRAALVGTGGPGRAVDPDACIDGFVWREAAPGDHVCVPQTHELTRQHNAAADSRRAG
jgi:FHA domain